MSSRAKYFIGIFGAMFTFVGISWILFGSLHLLVGESPPWFWYWGFVSLVIGLYPLIYAWRWSRS